MECFSCVHKFFFVLILIWLCALVPLIGLARRRAVRQGGPLLLAALRPRVRRWHLVFFAAWTLAIAAQWAASFLRDLTFSERLNLTNQMLILLGALALGQAGFPRWSLEFREHGIVDHALLSPWREVREFDWGDQPGLLRIWYWRRGIVRYHLDPRARDAVHEVLAACVGGVGPS